ncbi:MAG: hypothetical protein IJ867_01190 [Clostridia bacterium]|nr:hypothetical protein [Clostridia bacterium]
MEEKSSYKIRLLPMILLVVCIILLIVVIGMGMMLHEKNQTIASLQNEKQNVEIVAGEIPERPEEPPVANNTVETRNQTRNEVVNNRTNNAVENTATNENGYTGKIVENRGYVYDAQYSTDSLTTTSYQTTSGKSYSIKEIVVPYINMVSSDAKSVNEELEKLYGGYVEEFKVCSQNLYSYIQVSYKTYITSNIYSIAITVQRGTGDEETQEYLAYNFDIISGTKLDYNQVCYIAGVSNASGSIQEAIQGLDDYKNYLNQKKVSKEKLEEMKAEVEVCQNQTFMNYQESLSNNKLVYFLDDNLKLNIVVKVALPVGEEAYDKIVVVEA